MRIFVFSWQHESNSFAEHPTPLDAFLRNSTLPRGSVVLKDLAGTNTEWGGLIDRAAHHGWTLLPSISATATPSGPIAADASQTLMETILEDLAMAGPIDAIFAILHGAMQTELQEDGEGWILGRLREVVGPDVPIAVTLDPHANMSPAMVDHADIIVPYRTTPHVDQGETGRRCADLLALRLERGVKPCHAWAQPPQNDLDDGRTNRPDAPMARLLREADAIMAEDPAIAIVGLFGGFPWGNALTCGPSVLVSRWDGDKDAASALACDLATKMWDAREETTLPFHSLASGLAHAKTLPRAQGPLIFVDYADCPAGGSPGDNVELLATLIAQGESGFVYGICDDAATVARARDAGEGAEITVELGGKKDRCFSGKPLQSTARVLRLADGRYTRTGPVGTGNPGDMGPAALLDIAGVRVAVASRPTPIEDQAQIRVFGIEPTAERRMLLKAMNHFRADFDQLRGEYIYIDSAGLCSHDWRLFNYDRIRRPIHPFDDMAGLADAGLTIHISPAKR